MKFYQRVCLVVAQDGISGLFRRIIRKLFIKDKRHVLPPTQTQEAYDQLVQEFNEKARSKGYGDLRDYRWYHTIDLGNGLLTPGSYDYRMSLPAFKFPVDMEGMNVLDVGSATGFFAFEFEKRGANVISVELPSIAEWDMLPGEDKEQSLRQLMTAHNVNTVEEVHRLHLDGPFEFCRKALNSKVRRCHSTIYDLSAEKLGVGAFDLVFVGDVLLHTISPLRALAAVAPLCRGRLIISEVELNDEYQQPVMIYVGGEKWTESGNRTWWLTNRLCLEQMLKRLGFSNVSVVGRHTGVKRPGGYYSRAIIHATK